jgi:outer membrane cobalamin receptor
VEAISLRFRVGTAALLAAFLSLPAAAQSDNDQLSERSLEQLLGTRVVSASNTSEKRPEAPATVVVITREDIRERGYTEMSEILDDLPGMDVIRPYGDTYFKDYWRGFRNTIGEPFLLMLDGMILNHLYFNTADVLATLPLSNVERVEVVYGPASSVYGPNAFMGVINVITRPDKAPAGVHQTVRLTAGSQDTRIADLSLAYGSDEFRVSVTGRFDNGDVDRASGELYEYTKSRYYADRGLWGGFVDNPSLGGSFTSPHRNRALDLRIEAHGLELGYQYQMLDTGYGVEYAADRAQTRAVWARPEQSLSLSARRELGDTLGSRTLVRYRRADVSNDSFFVTSTSGQVGGVPAQLVQLSYWQSLNSSWSAFQDFDLHPAGRLSFTGGFKYEQKDLQKAYDINSGPAVRADELDGSTYPYPEPPIAAPQDQNRITTEDAGLYVQSRFRWTSQHQLHLGVRYDHNSQYGGATTVRAGYVGTYGRFGAKLLYGEAFQEPVPRLLYGGWTGSGSDPRLAPEKSHTFELSGSYETKRISGLLSLYRVENQATIITTAAGAENLGDRSIVGLDVHAQALFDAGRRKLRAWGYLSHLFQADEMKVGAAGINGRIGDLAGTQVHLGVTGTYDDHVWLTLRGRHVGERPTVGSNPIPSVPAFSTVDVTLGCRNVGWKGLGAMLKLTNLFGADYFEPGIREANAGDAPGSFSQNGVWTGSGGYYSSLLPQPGRAALVSLTLDF